MNRRAVLGAGAALFAAPRIARATGGLDVGDPGTERTMRVLLASGAFPAARQLDDWHFAWNGRTYRGTFSTVALADGRSALLNLLPLDAYLRGVLGSEISASWSRGAQEAQAIVSRTYALGRLRPREPYDVAASESDQGYGGIERESVEGRAAVDATAGTILTYADRPAHVAYSACCGGRTAAAGDVWKTPYPYLTSIVDPHCVGTPPYAWDAAVPLDALQRAFGASFASLGALKTVALLGEPDDRPRGIDFVGDASSFETTPAAFRASLGANVVRSTFVRSVALDRGGSSLTIAGTGRGHGVGLCQWGARVMGDGGAAAAEILAFYFPGTTFGRS
jgi:stage II sporulation protein D